MIYGAVAAFFTHVRQQRRRRTDGRTDGQKNERSFVSDKSKVNSDVSLSLRPFPFTSLEPTGTKLFRAQATG